MIRPRHTIGLWMWVTAAAAAGLVAFRAWAPDAGPRVAAAGRLGLDRLLHPEVALPVASSLGLGVLAFHASRQRPARASVFIELAYLIVVGTALLLGGGDTSRGELLVMLTGLAYPTILGAGVGHRVAARGLPPDRPEARLNDLLLALTVAPLLPALPALAYEPLRVALARSGWLN